MSELDERGYAKPPGPFKGGKEPCESCDVSEPWCRYWNLGYSYMCCKTCSHLRRLGERLDKEKA